MNSCNRAAIMFLVLDWILHFLPLLSPITFIFTQFSISRSQQPQVTQEDLIIDVEAGSQTIIIEIPAEMAVAIRSNQPGPEDNGTRQVVVNNGTTTSNETVTSRTRADDGETETDDDNEDKEKKVLFWKIALKLSLFLFSVAAAGSFAFTQVSTKNQKGYQNLRFIYVACNLSFAASLLSAILGIMILFFLHHDSLYKSLSLKLASGASFVFFVLGSGFGVAFNILKDS